MRALLAGIAVLIVGLGYWVWAVTPAPDQVARDHLVVPWPEPQTLNPFTTKSTGSRWILGHTHDGLLELTDDRRSLRGAAMKLRSSGGDGRMFRLELRDGLRFSDGRAVMLEDVLFTFEVSRDPEVPLGSIGSAMDMIESVDRLGEKELRIVLRERHFAGLGEAATEWPVISKEWWLRAVAERARASGVAVPSGPGEPGFGRLLSQVRMPGPGTGPFTVGTRFEPGRSWRPGSDLTLASNHQSWRRRAYPERWKLSGMVLRFLEDKAAQMAELQRQSLDWMQVADPEKVLAENPELRTHYRSLIYEKPRQGPYCVVWNHRRSHLASPAVRRALTMLFDRDKIIANLARGHASPLASWFPPGHLSAPADLKPLLFDPKAAAVLLSEAGHGPGNPLVVKILAGPPLDHRVLDSVRADFDLAGVELEIEKLGQGAWLERRNAHDFDGFLLQWRHGIWADPYEVFHSSQVGRGANYSGWSHAAADASLERARVCVDPVERSRFFADFNEIFHSEQPVTLLYQPKICLLVHRRFQDVEPGLGGLEIWRWWVTSDG